MTTAKLKDYYLTFWLKPEMAATRTARVIWGLGVLLVPLAGFASVVFMPVLWVTALPAMRDSLVTGPAVLVWMVLGVIGYLWLLSRPDKWRKERECEHTAELSDGQVATLNLKTANGVSYADKDLGDFLHNCLLEGVVEWEERPHSARATVVADRDAVKADLRAFQDGTR